MKRSPLRKHANEQPADQIAAEAWKQITDYADNYEDAIGDLTGDTNCIRFIQAAIEKALDDAAISQTKEKE